MARKTSGKRSRTKTERKRGRYIQARPMRGEMSDLAFDATLRAAAPFQVRRKHKGTALAIEKSDLQRKVRVRRAANLILFVVDASWSMGAMIKKSELRAVVINTEHEAFDRGLAQNLADTMGAPCYTLKQLRAEELVQRVKEEMKGK